MKIIRYRCDLQKGWQIKQGGNWELPTERASDFLPSVVDLLRKKPLLKSPICVVLQVRKLSFFKPPKLGTLISLQEVPSKISIEGKKNPKLVAPARFVVEKWNKGRKNREIKALQILLGIRSVTRIKNLESKLEECNWCYDVVLRIYALDEKLSDAALRTKNEPDSRCFALLVAAFDSIPPPHNCKINSFNLWSPDYEQNELKILDKTYCLPWLPPKERFSSDIPSVTFLVTHENSASILEEISDDIWQHPRAKNVIIAGEIGSGKEVAANLIHHGRSKGNLIAVSVGGEDWKSWRDSLLGQGQPSGPLILPGYIDQTSGGTLFIDEIDKAKQDLRGGLLRIIEANEYRRPGGIELVKLSSKNRPLFVFAGSGNGAVCQKIKEDEQPDSPFERMCLEPPEDFWNRRDKLILYPHPLKVDEKYNEVCMAIFSNYFIRHEYERSMKTDSSPYSSSKLLLISDTAIKQRLKEWYPRAYNFFIVRINEITKKREAYRKSSLPPIRLIRASAKIMVSKLEKEAHEKSDIKDLELKTIVSNAVTTAFSGWSD